MSTDQRGGRLDQAHIEEMLLGGELRYTRVQAAERAGVELSFAERIWRALGFASLPDDVVAFTDGDVASLRKAGELLKLGYFDEEVAIRLARAMGQTLARLAEWQVDIILGAMLDPQRAPTDEEIRGVVVAAGLLVPDFERLVVQAWRRQLAAAGTRALAVATAGDDVLPSRVQLTVGFADLVSFTRLSRDIDETALANLVESFETTASDIVSELSGRLVKTLGDEVLFVADTPQLGAEIALRLAETITADAQVPDVRVGVAYGPVLPLMGDVFGTTVNLASRLTSLARPGTVLVDSAMAHVLADTDGYELVRILRRPARGLGLIQPYVLRRAGSSAGST